MIKIGDKEFRNIQEQVEKNKQDIEAMITGTYVLDEFGIKVIGEVEQLSDMPTVAEYKEDNLNWAYGDAYAVGTVAPYQLYILTRANDEHPNDYWFNIGSFPAPGPQGEQGPQGETGPQGEQGIQGIQGIQGVQGQQGTSVRYTDYNVSTVIDAYTTVTNDSNINTNDIVVSKNGYLTICTSVSGGNAILQTLASLLGPQGEQGAQGQQGPQGVKGDTGNPGLGVYTTSVYLNETIGQTWDLQPSAIDAGGRTLQVNDVILSVGNYMLGKITNIGPMSEQYPNITIVTVESIGKVTGPQGPKGDTGATGPQGPAGQDGTDGTNGTDGVDGITPSITAAATVDSNTGTPSVTVTKTGTDASPTFTFEFHNLKGATGSSLINVQIVQTLPASGDGNTLYFVSNGGTGTNQYDEYIYVNGNWEKLGTTQIDLSNYIQKSSTTGLVKNDGTIDTNTYALASALLDYVTSNSLSTTLQDYVTNSSLATTLSNYVLSSSLSTVATSGDYDDLINKPIIPVVSYPVTDVTVDGTSVLDGTVAKIILPTPAQQVQANWTESDSTKPSYIQNKPTLATVATTGDYNDLLNQPSIPAGQVQTDWNATTGMGVLLNKPSLANVATSGDYNDLSNKPTIPTNYVTTDTIQFINGAKTFNNLLKINTIEGTDYSHSLTFVGRNNNSETYANLTYDGTNLTYDASGGNYLIFFPTPSNTGNKTLATTDQLFSGDYNDLTNTPTIPDTTYMVTTNTAQNITGAKTFKEDLVITSSGPTYDYTRHDLVLNAKGSYNTLLDGRIRVNNTTYGYILPNGYNMTADKTIATTDQIVTSYNDLTDKPTIPTVPITEIQVNSVTQSPVSGVVNISVPTNYVSSVTPTSETWTFVVDDGQGGTTTVTKTVVTGVTVS